LFSRDHGVLKQLSTGHATRADAFVYALFAKLPSNMASAF
jgi:hypothetical protein